MSATTHTPRTAGANSPLRSTAAVRALLEGPAITPADLSMVLLVTEDDQASRPMPTVTVAGIPAVVRDCARLGIRSVKIFAESTQRDDTGSVSLAPDSLMARAVHAAKDAEPDIAVMTETCLCSYTTGGLCYLTGPGGRPDLSATIEVTARQAVAHAEAGADIIGPASMVLGTTRGARDALDQAGYDARSVMPHVIYHSTLYDGFRLTMGATPNAGADRAFQINPGNGDQFLDSALRLVTDGADMLLLEPALFTADMLRDLKARTLVPLFPFSVSGEYTTLAPVDPATGNRDIRTLTELCTTLRRAGAAATVTYGAVEIARRLNS
ncbi:porphobilinogen synthase [Kitasatospora sp. MMS16-BH015]|uniref:hypothetical protein n=1 Tax=Kitasatospora sp. MMS16-BH015 TaxID=2018025 RepID=UPI000CA3181C|nr:hypothetical protein [Kitasatospora sp. MMS16-BH015]AUG78113.1 porphobilinogen synthase [Kitasatospora sp. MMS16-BH015]